MGTQADRDFDLSTGRDIERKDAEIARLRKGIRDFLDGDYDNPRRYRPAKCLHGRYWYEGCDECDTAHFEKLLG